MMQGWIMRPVLESERQGVSTQPITPRVSQVTVISQTQPWPPQLGHQQVVVSTRLSDGKLRTNTVPAHTKFEEVKAMLPKFDSSTHKISS